MQVSELADLLHDKCILLGRTFGPWYACIHVVGIFPSQNCPMCRDLQHDHQEDIFYVRPEDVMTSDAYSMVSCPTINIVNISCPSLY